MSETPWAFPLSVDGDSGVVLDPSSGGEIPIFAVSTFDTDYILVKEDDKERALETLLEAGHELVFR